MSFLDKINQLSYAKVISISIFLTLLFGIPTTVLLAQQQTQIASRAYQKPEPVTSSKPNFGPIPASPPQIGRVFPWVGKIGDIIFIQGKNFGTNPQDKALIIGGITVKEADIVAWNDDLIQVFIPQAAAQAGSVEVKVADHPISTSLPYVIYDRSTTLKLEKRGPLILAPTAANIAKIKVWTGDENTPTKLTELAVTPNPTGKTLLFDTQGQPLLTILIYDSSGNFLSYYVDPTQFDF